MSFQNGNPNNPYCQGIEGVLESYHKAIQSVQLYGPTNFAPCINHVAKYVSALSLSLFSLFFSYSLSPPLSLCSFVSNIMRHLEKVRYMYHDEKFFYSLRPLRIFTYLSYADMFVCILNAFSPYCINIEFNIVCSQKSKKILALKVTTIDVSEKAGTKFSVNKTFSSLSEDLLPRGLMVMIILYC